MCESGDNMRREEFLSACRRTEVSYRDSLLNFYKKYVDIVEKLYNKYILLDENNQNRMLIMKLKEWLEQSAYNDILFTINSLNEDSEQKVLGFINLYDYILETANDDYELIDQLFFIPGRFEKDFNVINNRVILNDDDKYPYGKPQTDEVARGSGNREYGCRRLREKLPNFSGVSFFRAGNSSNRVNAFHICVYVHRCAVPRYIALQHP